MDEFDSRRCEMAVRVIDAFLTQKISFRVTLGELRGLITLLRENELELSRALRDKWSILEEVRARTLYQRLPAMSPQSRALIESTLDEMKCLVLGRSRDFLTEQKKLSAERALVLPMRSRQTQQE